MGANEDIRLHFLAETRISNCYTANLKTTPIEFSPSADLRLTITSPNEADDGYSSHRSALCRATTSVPVAADLLGFVRALPARRFVVLPDSPISLPYKLYPDRIIDIMGRIPERTSIKRDHLPRRLQQIVSDTEGSLLSATRRFLDFVFWIQDITSAALGHSSLYWSDKDTSLILVPLPRQEPISGLGSMGLRHIGQDEEALQSLWTQENVKAPLARGLMREASRISHENPRSAFLLLATALEVGMKETITRLHEGIDDLVWELPSPPVGKMLRHLERVIQERQPGINMGELKKTFATCKNLSEHRNRLAHRGDEPKINFGEYFEQVSSLLYFFDFVCGHNWARDYYAGDNRRLGIPPKKNERMRHVFR